MEELKPCRYCGDEDECLLPNDIGCEYQGKDLNPDGSVNIFVMGALTSSEGQTAIKAMTGAEAYNHFLTLVCSVPAVDPIRAAGGCRCGECKHYVSGAEVPCTSVYGLVEPEEDDHD